MPKSKTTVDKALRDYLAKFKSGFCEQYPGLPEAWLQDEDICIEWIIEKDATRCREIVELSVYSLNIVEDSVSSSKEIILSDINNQNLKPWHAGNLWFLICNLIKNNDQETLIREAHKQSFTMTLIGLSTFWVIANRRYFRHLDDKGTYNQLLLWSADLPPEYLIARLKFIEVARRELSRSAIEKYKGMAPKSGMTSYNERLMTSYIWEYLKNTTKDVDKMLEMAESGHKDLLGAAKAGARDLFDENKKAKEIYLDDLEPVEATNLDVASNFRQRDFEAFKIISEFMDKFEDPKDKEIVLLRSMGYTLREIEQELSIPRTTVEYRLKKIRSQQ